MKNFVFAYLLIQFGYSLSFSQSKKDNMKMLARERDSLQIEVKLLDQACSAALDSMSLIMADLQSEVENLNNKLKLTEGVIMGRQTWMKYNLDVVTFRNGDIITQAQSNEDWTQKGFNKQPAWCYYVLDDANGVEKSHGKLYNLYAVKDPRGLAPEGWHISTESEWRELQDYLFTTDYYFEDIFVGDSTSKIDRGDFSEKCLKIGLGGWRDVGCGGLGYQGCYWLQSNNQDDDTPQVNIAKKESKSTEMDYLRNRNDDLFNFNSTSWIWGHHVRCVKD
jgi:uncharacterized protein (TIGR02145 family)